MNKIYISGNYVIIEKDGNVYNYPASSTIYEYNNTPAIYYVKNLNGGLSIPITESEITGGEWYMEDGVTPYDLNTFTAFIRTNTGNI